MTASFVAITTLIFFSKCTDSYQIYFGCSAVFGLMQQLEAFGFELAAFDVLKHKCKN